MTLPEHHLDDAVPAHQGDPFAEQRAAARAAAVVDRSHRGIIAVSGLTAWSGCTSCSPSTSARCPRAAPPKRWCSTARAGCCTTWGSRTSATSSTSTSSRAS